MRSQTEDTPRTASRRVAAAPPGRRLRPRAADAETRARNCAAAARRHARQLKIELDFAMNVGVEVVAPPGMEDMTNQLRGMFQSLAGQKTQSHKLTIAQARPRFRRGEAASSSTTRRSRRAIADAEAERHRLHRRDRQDRAAQRWAAAGVSRRRAARPAAAGGRIGGVDQIRHRQDRPHPVHRLRRVFAGPAVRPRAGAAGPLRSRRAGRC